MPKVKCKIDGRRLFDLEKDSKGKKIVIKCPKGNHKNNEIHLKTLFEASFEESEMLV